MTLTKFIDRYQTVIDEVIRAAVPNAHITNNERRLWVLNDEGLYNMAKDAGVRF